MSCGPAAGLKALSDKMLAANDQLDSLLDSATGGITDSLAGLEAMVLAEVGGLQDKMMSMGPSIDLPKVPTMLSGVEDLAKIVALGVVAAPQIANELATLEKKWGSILSDNPILDGDVKINDFKDLANLLARGGADLDRLCKMVPNIEEGLEVQVKGTPVSFPEIDAKALLNGHKLPKFVKPKHTVDVVRKKKEAGASFVNFKIPKIYSGPRG